MEGMLRGLKREGENKEVKMLCQIELSSVAMAEPSWDGSGPLISVTEEEVLAGVVFIACPNCGGVGLIPWSPDDQIEDCVLCKGTGRYPVGL